METFIPNPGASLRWRQRVVRRLARRNPRRLQRDAVMCMKCRGKDIQRASTASDAETRRRIRVVNATCTDDAERPSSLTAADTDYECKPNIR